MFLSGGILLEEKNKNSSSEALSTPLELTKRLKFKGKTCHAELLSREGGRVEAR